MLGSTLNDRYRIDSLLGEGGMGVLYRAYDLLLQREVAIKLFNEKSLGSQGRVRLLHEAQAAARLDHPRPKEQSLLAGRPGLNGIMSAAWPWLRGWPTTTSPRGRIPWGRTMHCASPTAHSLARSFP